MRRKRIFLIIILIQSLIFPAAASAFGVIVISDIHVSSRKKIEKDSVGNVIYPKKNRRCLNKVKKRKPDLVIATGDLVDQGEKKYYKQLRRAMWGMEVIWVKGNHDNKNFKCLAPKNYYTDYENWRFIALDSSKKFSSSTGYLDDSQIASLRKWLQTKKNVAIAMHHPPFFYNSREEIYTSTKEQRYNDFFESLTPNVRYVFTGHWHFNQEAEINKVMYLTQKALAQNNSCNYLYLSL